MKRAILFASVIWFCFTFIIGVEAQRAKNQKRPQQKPSQSKPAASQPKSVDKAQPKEALLDELQQQMLKLQTPSTIDWRERLKGDKGQKVILVGRYDYKKWEIAGFVEGFHREGKLSGDAQEIELSKSYVGKTGIIRDVVEDKEEHKGGGHTITTKYVIVLDGSGERILADTGSVGFFSEMEVLRNYIGRPVWAKGKIELIKDFVLGMTDDQIEARTFSVNNIQKLIVTRAEWGNYFCDVFLCFTTERGQEGCLFPSSCRFSSVFNERRIYLQHFYVEDPHRKFPDWSKTVWGLIENEEVAIGMTEDMVKLACRRLGKFGTVLSLTDPSDSGVIYEGCGRKFLIAGGKVTKYVKE